MVNTHLLELIEKEALLQKERMSQRLNIEKEALIMVPTRAIFNEKGSLERLSVINVQPYMKLNEEVMKDYCSICGGLVTDSDYIVNAENQKTHINCYITKQAHN